MISRRSKRALFAVFALTLLITRLPATSLITYVKEVKAKETPITKIEIVPSAIPIGRIGMRLPTPPTIVNVTVSNVTDLYSWQIKVYFDEEILQFENETGANIPVLGNLVVDKDNIFWNKRIFKPSAVVKSDNNTGKIRRYVLFGAMLLGDVPGVNGSGVLCQLNFTGVSTGSSYLNFSRPYGLEGGVALADTFLLNSTEGGKPAGYGVEIPIPSDVFDAEVTVLGNGISISVRPDELEVGQEVNITGLLFPQQDTEVTIYYRPNGTEKWDALATVQTVRITINETYYETGYTYIWKPDKDDLYELKAEGGGFKSREKLVRVTAGSVTQTVGIELYGSIVAVIAVSVIMVFIWDRRRRYSGRLILP